MNDNKSIGDIFARTIKSTEDSVVVEEKVDELPQVLEIPEIPSNDNLSDQKTKSSD